MPSKMEVASQHWTDWTDWTDWTGFRTLKAKCVMGWDGMGWVILYCCDTKSIARAMLTDLDRSRQI